MLIGSCTEENPKVYRWVWRYTDYHSMLILNQLE